MDLDVLAFGAHPDDIEIGMGGTIAKLTTEGFKVGVCNLTNAELSSNGSVPIRQEEAERASEILHVTKRIQLNLPDRGLYLHHEYIKSIVSIIRSYKPRTVFYPYHIDRHPDHGNCGMLVKEALFSSGIKKFIDDMELPAHKVQNQYSYMINGFHKPNFYVDISDYVEEKQKALAAYKSQFEREKGSVETPLTSDYINTVISREKVFGKEIGVQYAEGFFAETPLVLNKDLVGGSH